MKKNDGILIAVILVVALLFAGIRFLAGNKEAGSVVVTVDGEVQGIYDLTEEQEIDVNDTNHFVIAGGEVQMAKANCPDQYCVHHSPISKSGESIICLPNKVVLEIKSAEASEYDAVTN